MVRSMSEQIRIAKQGTLAQTKTLLVTTAKAAHARIMASPPEPTGFQRVVDGIAGAPEDAVKPYGVIAYFYNRLDLVVAFALDELRKRSPVLSGDYARSHTLFVNGTAQDVPRNLKPTDDIAISNFQPYARKIEIGRMRMRVPGTDKVYAEAQRVVSARYGNVVRVSFTYRGLVGGAVATGRAATKSVNRFPALVFRPVT